MFSKEYLFFLRAHLSWSSGGFICLIIYFYANNHFLNVSPAFFHWAFAFFSYFLGVIIFINIWASLEQKIDQKQYKQLVPLLPQVIFFGRYLKKAIVVK